jgi:hypothetical protein
MITASVDHPTRISVVGPFTPDVTDGRGRINVRDLAFVLDLPMTTLAPSLGFKVRWLNANPTAVNAQEKAAVVLLIANTIATEAGDKKYVPVFMRTRQPGLQNETPAEQLRQGRLDYLAAFVGQAMHPDLAQ